MLCQKCGPFCSLDSIDNLVQKKKTKKKSLYQCALNDQMKVSYMIRDKSTCAKLPFINLPSISKAFYHFLSPFYNFLSIFQFNF